jgi:ABC-type Fe3+-hydroxamate transport system substrate-binding protein
VPFVLPTRFVPFAAILAAVVACAAPASDARSDAATLVDDFGDPIVAGRAQRVASLNPATTELVFAMGAGDRLVGRTHWDSYPAEASAVTDLGDGMRPNVEAVLAARPDLVLLYASAENRPARDAFQRAGVATLTLRIDAVADFARAMEHLGRVLGDTVRAFTVRDSVLSSIEAARAATRGRPAPRVVWPLWDAPLLVVGRGSFLNELLDAAGAENIFADIAAPSPPITFEELMQRDPDVVLVGPNRAETLKADGRWRTLRAVREGRVLVYDTLLVGRPGVRLGEAALHLTRLLHGARE